MSTNRKSRKGKKAPHLEPDQIIARSRVICDMYAGGEDSIEKVCRDSGLVSLRTFTRWKTQLAEVAELYKSAKEVHERVKPFRIKKAAKLALVRKLEGYEDREEETKGKPDPENPDKMVATEVKVRKRRVEPDTGAIAFALKNVDPEHWKDSHEHDLGKDTKQSLFDFLAEIGRREMKSKSGEEKSKPDQPEKEPGAESE